MLHQALQQEDTNILAPDIEGIIAKIIASVEEPAPDKTNIFLDTYEPQVDAAIYSHELSASGHKKIGVLIGLSMLAIYKEMQDYKFFASMGNGGDIGIAKTVKHFKKYQRIDTNIREQLPTVSDTYCRDGFSSFVAYHINKMVGYPEVEEIQNQMPKFEGNRVSSLATIPEFILSPKFPQFLLEARTEYCGPKDGKQALCPNSMQCVGAASLYPKNQLYFG